MRSQKNIPAKTEAKKKAAAAVPSPRKSGAQVDWEKVASKSRTQAPKSKVQAERAVAAEVKAAASAEKNPPVSAGRGRPPGSKSKITDAKLRFLAQTGQTPLEFLTAVYRDQLYDEYEVEVVDAKRNVVHVFPKLDPITGDVAAQKIKVDLGQRIQAATSAAPYVHRKKPIGIDGGEGKPVSFVSAAQLAALSDEELDKLLSVLGKLQVGAEFEGVDGTAHGLDGEPA